MNLGNPLLRGIVVVALLQIGTVIGGTLYVSAMLKLHGSADVAIPTSFYRPEALFVRQHGFVLLSFPLAWAVVALWSAIYNTRTWILLLVFLLGVSAIPIGIYQYVMLGFNATII